MDNRNMIQYDTDKIKLLVIGQTNVGKSTIVEQLRGLGNNILGKDVNANPGNCSSEDQITFAEYNNFPFPSFRKLFIKSADAFMLTYAVDDESSYDFAISFVKEIKELKGPNASIIVAANKIDTSFPEVDIERAENEVMYHLGCTHIEVCGIDGEGVKELFSCLLGYFGHSLLYQVDINDNTVEIKKGKNMAKRLSRFVFKKFAKRK